jgi:hypothetical protein
MTKQAPFISLGLSAFGLFVVLGGLALLSVTNEAAPGCTGPVVQHCDYVSSAKAAVAKSNYHPFQRDLGFEIFDQGSTVLVQQFTPPGEPELNHAPSVLIDRRSCRACRVDWHFPTGGDPLDPHLGPLVSRVPAEDPVAAEKRAQAWKDGRGGIAPL